MFAVKAITLNGTEEWIHQGQQDKSLVQIVRCSFSSNSSAAATAASISSVATTDTNTDT